MKLPWSWFLVSSNKYCIGIEAEKCSQGVTWLTVYLMCPPLIKMTYGFKTKYFYA